MDFPTLYTQSPSDSMRLLGRGELPAPAACFKCGSGNCEEGYVDFGVFFDFEGEMLACRDCVLKAAELVGCMPPSVVDDVKEKVEVLSAEHEEVKKELENAKQRLSVFNSMFADYATANPDAMRVSDSETPEQSAGKLHADSSTQSDSSGSGSKPPKPTKVAGRSDSKQSATSDESDAGPIL